MKIKHLLYSLLLVTTFSIFFSGCSDGTTGIFATLEEIKNVSANSSNTISYITPSSLVEFKTKYYIAHGGSLKSRALGTISTDAWKGVTVLNSNKVSFVASDSSKLYVSCIDTTGAAAGVYESSDGTTWAKISGTETMTVDGLWNLNNTLYALVRDITGTSYTVKTGADLSTNYFTPDSFIIDAAFDGTNPIFITTSKMYVATTEDTSKPASVTFSGLSASSDALVNGVLVATNEGNIYARNSSGTWTACSTTTSTDLAKYGLTSPIFIENSASTKYLLVGTQAKYSGTTLSQAAKGYLSLNISTGLSTSTFSATDYAICDSTNFITSLTNKAVTKFFLSSDSTLFAFTKAEGLWSIEKTGTTWGSWQKE